MPSGAHARQDVVEPQIVAHRNATTGEPAHAEDLDIDEHLFQAKDHGAPETPGADQQVGPGERADQRAQRLLVSGLSPADEGIGAAAGAHYR